MSTIWYGVFRFGHLSQGVTKLWKEVFDTNVLGLCIATREAVQDMKANKVDGHIIHINSLAGHRVPNIPNMNVYHASKYAVTALTETLRNELNSFGSKIKISSVSPGLVKTEIFETSAKDSGLKEFPKEMKAVIESFKSLDPQDVADAVKFVLGTPPHVQIQELMLAPVSQPY